MNRALFAVFSSPRHSFSEQFAVVFQIAYHCSGTEFAEEYFIMSGRRSVALLLLLLPASLPAYSLWKTIKTDAFNVFYPKGMEREAEEIFAGAANRRLLLFRSSPSEGSLLNSW